MGSCNTNRLGPEGILPRMYHANAPLTFEGRRRLVARCLDRPQSHVAAEMGISRQCVSKWFTRWRRYGEIGLYERSSQPYRQPTTTSTDTIDTIETLSCAGDSRGWEIGRRSFSYACEVHR